MAQFLTRVPPHTTALPLSPSAPIDGKTRLSDNPGIPAVAISALGDIWSESADVCPPRR